MDTARYLVRMIDPNSCTVTVFNFMCEATDETNALEQAENQYPGWEFLSCERIEYPGV